LTSHPDDETVVVRRSAPGERFAMDTNGLSAAVLDRLGREVALLDVIETKHMAWTIVC
jgi:hypothetical protein